MIEVSSREEIRRAIASNRVVVIEYYDRDSREGREFSKAVKYLEKHIDPSIIVLRVSAKDHPELLDGIKALPTIRMYLNGKLVFEQQGGFGNTELDLMVLRRSMRSVLRSFNIAFKI